jgi:hypothetical protein
MSQNAVLKHMCRNIFLGILKCMNVCNETVLETMARSLNIHLWHSRTTEQLRSSEQEHAWFRTQFLYPQVLTVQYLSQKQFNKVTKYV